VGPRARVRRADGIAESEPGVPGGRGESSDSRPGLGWPEAGRAREVGDEAAGPSRGSGGLRKTPDAGGFAPRGYWDLFQ